VKSIYEMANRATNTRIPAAGTGATESLKERAARIQREFSRHESRLQEWTQRCTINAIWYLSDPFGAMRSANVGIEEGLISELEALHEECARRAQPRQVRKTA
jgi:hypothetical protein